MKTRIKYIIFLLALFQATNSFSQFTNTSQWKSFYGPRFRQINDLYVQNPGYLIGVGGNETNDPIATIINSVDGGSTWGLSKDSISAWLRAVDFADNSIGISVGAAGQVLRTASGGAAWTNIAVDAQLQTRSFNDVFFTSTLTGYIVGGNPYNDSIQTILQTTDGGLHWSILVDRLGYWLRKVNFPDASHGFAVGDNGMVLKTTDAGQNWNPVVLPGNTKYRQLNSVYFSDSIHGIIVGGNPSGDSIQTILKTSDGGANWDIISDNMGPMLNDVSFYTSQDGIAVGDYGTLMQTVNAGANWQAITLPDTINDSNNLNCVKFKDAKFGVAAGQYGKFIIFSDTSNSTPIAITGTAWIMGGGKVKLSGTVNPRGNPTNVVFEYGETPALGLSTAANPAIVDGTLPVNVSVELQSFDLHKTYYFRIRVTNPVGLAYSQILSFNPGFTLPSGDVVLLAPGKVRLVSHVNPHGLPTLVNFEYGESPLTGSSVAASEGIISDTSLQQVSTELSGLNPEKMYYFRIMTTNSDFVAYSTVQNFYPGYSVPNWSFENWDTTQQTRLHQWNASEFYTRVTSYDGSNAVELHSKLSGPQALFHASAGNQNLSGGIPFTDRPDSIYGYFNYSIGTGDTALILVNLKHNGQTVVYQISKIFGNSANQFLRLSFPIHYASGTVPDSLILGIVSSNYFGGHNDTSSYLILDNLGFSNSVSGIPNGDFEQWDTSYLYTPSGWALSNYNSNEKSDSVLIATQDSYVGKYALELRNDVQNHTYGSVSTYLGDNSYAQRPSFKVFARHLSTGVFLKYFPEAGDSLFLNFRFYKNDSLVGASYAAIDSTITEFSFISMPVFYYNDSIVPDSATVWIMIHNGNNSNPVAISRAIIDAITFDGMSTLVRNLNETISSIFIQTYPNPSAGLFNLSISKNTSDLKNIRIYSVDGRLSKTLNIKALSDLSVNPMLIDISSCPNGMYLLELSFGNNEKRYQKILIQK
jgi:photosystem II stability/assembly factor-like uncharacterized protein